MPIYEYRCDACNTVFEEWHRHADDITLQPCPKCREEAHRLISNTSFVLKGGGWYVTEYGSRKPEGGAETSVDSGVPATPATETKTDSAPSAVPAAPAAPAAKAESAAVSS